MIKTYFINEENDLLGVLSVRAINTLKVRNSKELEQKKEEILKNLQKHGYIFYGRKTTLEFLKYYNLDPVKVCPDWGKKYFE